MIIILPAFPSSITAAAVFPGCDAIPALPDSQSTYENWIQSIGKPKYSRIHNYHASYNIYRDYNLLVYGSPAKVAGNRYHAASGQYAYLGYSYDEVPVTNSLFPDDAPGGVTQTSPWQWVELDLGAAARLSWSRLNADEKAIIHAGALTYRCNNYGGMNFQNLNLKENTTVVVAPPSWHLGYALYTNHYLPGTYSIRYATFNGLGGGDVALACDIHMRSQPGPDGKYILAGDEEEMVIEYDIAGQITGFQGLAKEQDIKYRGAGIETAWTAGSGAGPWIQPMSLTVRKSDLAGGERTFTLQGSAWIVSNLGDIRLVSSEKTITVSLQKADEPFQVNPILLGSIRYFSGQTNRRGLVMPVQPHRFLALEQMNIRLEFTQVPQKVEVKFANKKIYIQGKPDQLIYTASMIIPALPSTLSWDNRRLAQPLILEVSATAAGGSAEIVHQIKDIDITGDIYDIAFSQLGP